MRASVKKQLVLWGVWGFVVVGVPACASLLGLKDGEVPADASLPQDGSLTDVIDDRAPIDGGFVDPDASFAICGDAGGSVADVTYWVTQDGAGGQCTKSAPCPLDFALKTVKTGEVIHLASGNYADQDISANAATNVRVEGGWKYTAPDKWETVCLETLANLTSTTKLATLRTQSVHNWTFALLSINNSRIAVGNQSNFGLLAVSSQLTLENVRVFTSAGGPGAPGTPGANTALNAPPPCPAGNGMAGVAGGTGQPANFVCNDQGCSDVSPGGAGFEGANGQNGAAGGDGGCNTGCKTCVFSVSCTAQPTSDVCAEQGTAGCGGARGGPGGSGATSGGSSIAIYAWGSNITFVAGGAIKAAKGGNGGSGGGGGTGLDGNDGGFGNSGSGICYPAPTCTATGSSSSCFTMGSSAPPPQGGPPGTKGGHGGPGGQGGGGSGGHSFCIYKDGTSIITNPPSNTQFDLGGLGGAAGGVNGGNNVMSP